MSLVLGWWRVFMFVCVFSLFLVRYPFAWRTVSSFVLREKSKGPPDNMVTLEVEKNV